MDDAFGEWFTRLRASSEQDRGELVPGTIDFLREVFATRGPVSRTDAETAFRERQAHVAREAAALVEQDIRRTTALRDARVKVWFEEELLAVALNGHYQAPAVFSIRMPEMTREVADYVRDFVVEELSRAWPVCKNHNVGLWPEVVDDQAVWRCRSDGRIIATIGVLV